MRAGRGDHKRNINIGTSFEALGDAKSQVLVGFHAFTGCDQTGKFNDHAKQSCWNTFITSLKKIIDAFMLLGNSIKHPMEECIDGIIMHRSHYTAYIWKSAISTNPILPDPENFG